MGLLLRITGGFGGHTGVRASVVLGLLTVALAAYAAPGAFQVNESSREAVRFSLEGLEPVWQARTVREGGLVLHEATVPGFVTGGPVGGPRVPAKGGWLVVPPGMRAVAVTLDEEWSGAGDRRLAVEPVPVIQRGVEAHETGVAEILVLPGESIPAGLEVPEGARRSLAESGGAPAPGLSLGEPGWWRGHRVVPFRITALQVDGEGVARRALRGGTWEVRFVADKAARTSEVPELQARRTGSANDNRFGGTFLNGDLLGALPTAAAHFGLAGSQAPDKALVAAQDKRGTLLGHESRLAVTRTKMVRVTYASLSSRGLLPDVDVQESELRLYQRRYLPALDDGSGAPPYAEVEVPIHVYGDGGLFDGDDFFVFYGLRLRDDTAYTADLGDGLVSLPGSGDPHEQSNEVNVYWLAPSTPEVGESWARMPSIALPPASGTPLPHYRRSDHVEEQISFRENLPNVASDRLFFNNYLDSEVTVPVALYPPAPTPTAGPQLQVGLTSFNTISRNLRLEWVTDDTIVLLENYALANTGEEVRTYSPPTAALLAASGRVRMTANPVGGRMYSFLNWVELSYDALYEAVDDRVEFHAGTGTGARPIEVTGFGAGDLGLFEITDPRNPVHVALAASNVVADGAGFKLSIMPDQTAGETRRFFAVGEPGGTGVDEYVSFRSTADLDPASPTATGGADPDVVVVTHGDFRDALDRWVDHRVARSGGELDIHVVDVQNVFDWYSGGLRDAWAIKRFAAHAVTAWDSWALVIVGDANENARELEVLPQAKAWSKDWVPTHYHVQHASGYAPELMASDKWFTSLEAGSNYPNDPFPFDVSTPWDMYTGRFPCNSVADLNAMIDKVIAVETLESGQDWRRRGLFFADDEWSNGLGVLAQSELTYHYGEVIFGRSEREDLATMWSNAAVALDSHVVMLKPYMDEGFPYVLPPPPQLPDPRSLGAAREYAEATATAPLFGMLNLGGLIAHYQGHANPYVFSSEFWVEDRRTSPGRKDIDLLANTGRPWLFMGMGCHIADWAQNAYRSASVPNESSLSEKMLVRAGSGASAIYASSGFEFITANKDFGAYIVRRLVEDPPLAGAVRTSVAGNVPRSRWMAGEVLWAAEADIKATKPWYPYPEMISQYVLLGDPLMMLDAGEPQASAVLLGESNTSLSGEADIAALDASNLRTVTIEARDEAGIDRLEVVDSRGVDLTSQIVTESLPAGATTHQVVDYTLQVPVRPFDHSLSVRVFDTAGPLPGDRHWELVLNMPQTATFLADGEVLDPDSWVFRAEEPVAMTARVASSAVLSSGMALELTSTTLDLANIVFDFQEKGRELDVSFTATAPVTDPDATHEVVLMVDGLATPLVLQSGAGDLVPLGIGRVFNFPNPMGDATRFVFESDAGAGEGVIRVFSVAGRAVARLPFTYDGNGRHFIGWDGRDAKGDELGNGTYLYRIELDATSGRVVSDMQRLVVMR